MIDINRRKMIMGVGAAGSLMALGGARRPPDDTEQAVNLDWINSTNVVWGTSPPHEVKDIPLNAGRRYPKPKRTPPPTFSADHLCLVYLKFEGAKIRIKHAYFVPTANPAGVVSQQFSNMSSNGTWTNPIRSEDNFNRFSFGSPTMIYIFLDHPGGEVELDNDNLIQFSTFGARKAAGQLVPKHEHNCFLNPAIDSGTWPGKKLLVIENWYTHYDGTLIGNRHQYYSMNIHLLMKCAIQSGGHLDIPIVLDPDTGNNGTAP